MKKQTGKRIAAFAMMMVLSLSLVMGIAGPNRTEAAEGLYLSDEALKTLTSLEKVTDNYYQLDYHMDYALDDLLKQGVKNDKELAAFAAKQVLQGFPFNGQAPRLGCSSFTASMPNGDFIHGRNLDIADAQNTVVRTTPKDGYASLSTASGLLLGYTDSVPDSMIGRLAMLAAPYYPTDGINEKGLSVAILLLYGAEPVSQDRGNVPITTTLAIRMLLDKAATVTEAIQLLDSYDMHSVANSNIHYQIADANGDSVVVEYVDGKMEIFRSEGNGLPVTNYFISPNANEKNFDGKDRMEKLQTALEENKGVVTEEKAWEMLQSIIAVNDYDELSGVNYNTSYSIIFNNSKRTMDVCPNMKYDKVYSFKVLDK